MDFRLCIHLLPSQCPLQPHSLHIRQMHSILQMSHTFFMMCFPQHADVFPSFQTLTSKPSQILEIYTHNIGPYDFHNAEGHKMKFKVYSRMTKF